MKKDQEQLAWLASLLRSLRIQSEYTQAELARAVGITERTLHSWEMGLSEPGLLSGYRLLRHLGQTIPCLEGLPELRPESKRGTPPKKGMPSATRDVKPVRTFSARKLLERRGELSQKELATIAGISQTMISRFERGDSRPSRGTLAKLAVALGCQEADLLDS